MIKMIEKLAGCYCSVALIFALSAGGNLSGGISSHAFFTDTGSIKTFFIRVDSIDSPHYNLGRAYGMLIAENEPGAVIQMKNFIKHNRGFYADLDPENRIGILAENLPRRYKEEIRGFADGLKKGSGGQDFSYEDALYINLSGDATRMGPFCTALAFRNREKNILAGRNLDWIDMGSFHTASGLSFFCYENSQVASLGLTGILSCTTGINKAGVMIAVLSNIQPADQDFEGTDSLGFSIRDALERSDSAEQAAELLKAGHYTYSCTLFIVDSRIALALEKSGKNFHIRHLGRKDRDFLIATNHFTRLQNDLPDAESMNRYETIKNSLEKEDTRFDNGLITEILGKSDQDCHIYRELTQNTKNRLSTLMSVIFEPENMNLHLWFARKIPAGGQPDYERIDLGKFFSSY